MKTLRSSPSAAALALAAILGSLAAPAAPASPGHGAPAVSEQTQRTPDNSSGQQTTQSSQAQQTFDDPKRRLHRQGYNWKRQVRRRLEAAGHVTSGRQWKRLLREVQRMRRFDRTIVALANQLAGVDA